MYEDIIHEIMFYLPEWEVVNNKKKKRKTRPVPEVKSFIENTDDIQEAQVRKTVTRDEVIHSYNVAISNACSFMNRYTVPEDNVCHDAVCMWAAGILEKKYHFKESGGNNGFKLDLVNDAMVLLEPYIKVNFKVLHPRDHAPFREEHPSLGFYCHDPLGGHHMRPEYHHNLPRNCHSPSLLEDGHLHYCEAVQYTFDEPILDYYVVPEVINLTLQIVSGGDMDVVYEWDGVQYHLETVNGAVDLSLPTSGMKSGTYRLEIHLAGNDKYAPVVDDWSINIAENPFSAGDLFDTYNAVVDGSGSTVYLHLSSIYDADYICEVVRNYILVNPQRNNDYLVCFNEDFSGEDDYIIRITGSIQDLLDEDEGLAEECHITTSIVFGEDIIIPLKINALLDDEWTIPVDDDDEDD